MAFQVRIQARINDVLNAESLSGESPTRRNFYVGAIYAIGAAICAALGVPALVYLFLPPKAQPPDEWIEIGDATRLSPNAPTEMSFRRNRVDGWKVISEKSTAWVVKGADNRVAAFGPQCTHLGCAYHWDDGKNLFLCPCHNSLFGADGSVKAGPAPRPLDRYDIKVQGSKLLIGNLRQVGESKA
jgi:menaquinol-cytochrome c reductase iron-sulfur subunit